MSTTSTPSAPAPTPTLTTATTHTAAPSLSPTTSSRSQNSPSMPSSSSSHPHPASLSPSESNERQIAEARAFLAASMNNIGSSLDRTLQERARNLHDNSKVLEKQQKEVGKATEGLRKENEKLAKMVNDGSKKIKELGNVQNWAEMLERDFLVLGEWVRLVDAGSEPGSESGSSWIDSEGEEEDHGAGSGNGKEVDGDDGNASEYTVDEGVQEDRVNGKAAEVQHEDGQGYVDADGDAHMQDTLHEAPHEKKIKASDGDQQMTDTVDSQAGTIMDPSRVLVEDMDIHTNHRTPTVTNDTRIADLDHAMAEIPTTRFENAKDGTILEHNAVGAKDIQGFEGVIVSSTTGDMPTEEPSQNLARLENPKAT